VHHTEKIMRVNDLKLPQKSGGTIKTHTFCQL